MSFEEEERPGTGGGRDYEEGPLSKGNMKCTDTPWLVFYLLFKLGAVRTLPSMARQRPRCTAHGALCLP